MASKLGESPRKSAAAYLLFYRRRSEKPLGPQYLQDLVTEFCNPPQQANSADEASESESGEGRLGDPSSILRGSSSNSVGAGVGATTGLQLQARSTTQGGGNGSAGQQVGQNLKPRTLGTSDDEGISMEEDNNKQYGNHGGQSWSFDALDEMTNNADTDAEMAISIDNDSTAAEHDTDRDDSWNDLDDSFQLGAGDNMEHEYEDDHALYSGAHDPEAFHIEDTNMMSDDSPVVDINLSDDPHSKMD